MFNMTMDQAERNLAARDQEESLEKLKKARAQYYKTLLVKESTVGFDSPGGGDVCLEMLMAVTNREIAAGRMAEIIPSEQWPWRVPRPRTPHTQSWLRSTPLKRSPKGPASTSKTDSSKVAYAFGSIVGRKVKGFFRE